VELANFYSSNIQSRTAYKIAFIGGGRIQQISIGQTKVRAFNTTSYMKFKMLFYRSLIHYALMAT